MPISYVEASKLLGWEPRYVSIPSPLEAIRLRLEMYGGNQEAFIEIFKIHRFAKSPMNDIDKLALKHIEIAFAFACKHEARINNAEKYSQQVFETRGRRCKNEEI
jgi:hypothetical protein